VPPSVQSVRPDGFVVAYETDVAADGALEVEGQVLRTRGVRHEARVTGLAAGRHAWSLRVDGRRLAEGAATTEPLEDRPFTFVVYGDTRDSSGVEAESVRQMLGEAPDLALHTGDLVPRGDEDAAWRQFFTIEAPLLGAVPVYPTIGNHELIGDEEGARFRRYFVLPGAGGGRADDRFYSFRYAAARFVVLDANAVSPAQTAWLERTLADATTDAAVRHVFVLLHQPPLSVGGHCGAGADQAAWVGLFERYGVRAVFAGHDHAYERLERHGVRYFISGGGGAGVYAERPDCPGFDRAARRVYFARHHYLRVRVAGDHVELTAVPVGGAPGERPLDEVRWDRHATLYADGPALVDDRAAGGLRRTWFVAGALAVAYVVGRRLRAHR
jgi:hypothetical protein